MLKSFKVSDFGSPPGPGNAGPCRQVVEDSLLTVFGGKERYERFLIVAEKGFRRHIPTVKRDAAQGTSMPNQAHPVSPKLSLAFFVAPGEIGAFL